MTNLKTIIKDTSSTSHITKSFNTYTHKGNKIKVSVTRRIVHFNSKYFNSKYEYLIFIGDDILKPWDKKSFFYYVNFIDEYYTNNKKN